jgi:hypothetical protein
LIISSYFLKARAIQRIFLVWRHRKHGLKTRATALGVYNGKKQRRRFSAYRCVRRRGERALVGQKCVDVSALEGKVCPEKFPEDEHLVQPFSLALPVPHNSPFCPRERIFKLLEAI